eukprot:TRINITY_DN26193_c0_g1_i1.p1 TRINITY_DN26193_c0_g1~~TRINITY_DN26193_c0_g1_i1.p1  ORF type:complete len:1146 (+),score=202.87 TRINITY_DN26193_c0_g1_i1:273-3710(+)
MNSLPWNSFAVAVDGRSSLLPGNRSALHGSHLERATWPFEAIRACVSGRQRVESQQANSVNAASRSEPCVSSQVAGPGLSEKEEGRVIHSWMKPELPDRPDYETPFPVRNADVDEDEDAMRQLVKLGETRYVNGVGVVNDESGILRPGFIGEDGAESSIRDDTSENSAASETGSSRDERSASETHAETARVAVSGRGVDTGKRLVQPTSGKDTWRREGLPSKRPSQDWQNGAAVNGSSEHVTDAHADLEDNAGREPTVAMLRADNNSFQAVEDSRPQNRESSAAGASAERSAQDQKPLRFIPPQAYLNQPKLPYRGRSAVLLGGPAAQKLRKRGVKGHLNTSLAMEAVNKLAEMKYTDDIDGTLNEWEGRKERANFPTLIRETAKFGDLKLTLRVFNWMKAQQNYHAESGIYSVLIRLCGRHRKLNIARQLFKEMAAWRCKPTVDTYIGMISASGRAGHWEAAIKLFESMLQNEVAPNRAAYNALIHACGVSGQWVVALKMYERMQTDGVFPDMFTYNTLLTAFKNASEYERGIAFYKKMQANGVRPDRFTLNIVLGLLVRLGQLDEMARMFEEMKAAPRGSGLEADVITFNLMLHSYSASGKYEEAKALFDEMVGYNFRIDLITYNTLMDAYATAGKALEAQEVFSTLQRVGHEPDVVSYSCLINAYGKASMPDEAREVLGLLKRRFCKPNVVLYNVLIDAFSRAGRLDEAVAIKSEMETLGLQPSIVTICSMITACGRSGNPDRVHEYVEEARVRQIPLNVPAYNALIWVLLSSGMHSAAISAYREMKEKGLEPDAVTFCVLVDQAAKEGHLEAAKEMFGQMASSGLKLTVVTGTAMVDAYGSQGMALEARRVVEEMKRTGEAPNVVTYTALLQAYGRAGMYEEARKVFVEMEAAGIEPDVIAYGALMHEWNRGERYKETVEVGRLMERRGVVKTDVTYNELFKAAGRLKDGVLVDELYREMMAAPQCTATPRTVVLLLEGFARTDQLERMSQAFQELRNRPGPAPLSLPAYNTLLRGLSRGGRWRQALQVLEWLDEAELRGTTQTFNLLLGVVASAGLWEEAIQLFERMENDGIEPDLITYRLMAGVLLKGGQMEMMNEMRERMEKLGKQDAEALDKLMSLLEMDAEVDREGLSAAGRRDGE